MPDARCCRSCHSVRSRRRRGAGGRPRASGWPRCANRRGAAAIPARTPPSLRQLGAPVGAPERILALAPAIHQRQAVAKMIDVRGNRWNRSACAPMPRRRIASRASEGALRRRDSTCSRRLSTRRRPVRPGACRASSKYPQCSYHFAGGTPRWNRESAASGLFLENPGLAFPQNFPARYVALRTRVCRSR